MVLTLFLIGFFLDSSLFTGYYIIKGNKQEIKKFLSRVLIVLFPLLVGLIILSYYFPEYLKYVLDRNLLGLFFEAIRVFHDALLVFSSVLLLYAIYLKAKKLPGAIWYIKKFTVYYLLSLFFLLITYMVHTYSEVLLYMVFLLILFVLFHGLYFIFRKCRNSVERSIEEFQKKLGVKHLIVLLVVIFVLFLAIILYTTHNISKPSSEMGPEIEKVEIIEETEEVQEDQESREYEDSLEVEEELVEDEPILYINPLFNLLREEVLQKETRNYEERTLDKNSNGVLAILSSDFGYAEENNYQRILFIDENTKQVFTLSDNLFKSVKSSDCPRQHFICNTYPDDFLLLESNLYFLHGPYYSWTLQEFDILGGEVTTVDLKYKLDESVISYVISEDIIYYLYGRQCREYMGFCNSSLYSYNAETNETILIATNLPYRDIELSKKDKGTLLMFYRDGDAGFSWLSYGTYNILSKELSEVKEINFGYDWDKSDEENEEEYEETFKEFLNLVEAKEYVPYLIIQNGEIVLPDEKHKMGDYDTSSIRIY